jgi:hypothetical protein
MKTQQHNFLRRPLLVGGFAAIMVGGIAIASLAISSQAFNGAFEAPVPPKVVAAQGSATARAYTYRCDDCGVIESMRKIDAPDDHSGAGAPGRTGTIEGEPLRNYEITIRMQDGSVRVIREAKSAYWRHGEPVTLIAGAD